MSSNKLMLGFSANRQFPFFESGSFFFFLRGAFENGLKQKACHKISIFGKCVLLRLFNVCFCVLTAVS